MAPLHSLRLLFVLSLCGLLTIAGVGALQVDLTPQFNAKAASTGVKDVFADFDGFRRALPVEYLPREPLFNYQGVEVRTMYASYPSHR